MRDTLRRICELQPYYSSKNTPEMQERGRLVRQVLTEDIRALRVLLSAALGEFGHDILVEGSDGIGRKTELAWTRFCSEEMSPRPTDGFYVVLHFSTDGSGVNIAVGCSSSKFHNGYSVVLPPNELDNRCEWARRVVLEDRGSLEPFTDPSDFGARAKLPQSFERASALVKKVAYADIEDDVMERHLIEAAEMLRAIYAAQRQGRELSRLTKLSWKYSISHVRPQIFAKDRVLGSMQKSVKPLKCGQWASPRIGYVCKAIN
ncbi:MrcB family domain-containing protein [Paracoccus aerius]|uniref:MrcB family domain-containing protein n=1 Tax=Paracoccus aerius TaxID=1915382 RepID=UPI00362437C7